MEQAAGSISAPTQTGEVREVQFVVDRDCPQDSPGEPDLRNPFVVWVKWPPVRQEDECEDPCAEIAYEVSKPHPRLDGFPGYLCPHMGHLIE